MITMVNEGGISVPAISSPEVLSDIDDVKNLRDSLMEMLEMVLYDEDLTYFTPNNHLYIVAQMIHVLTRDIESIARDSSTTHL